MPTKRLFIDRFNGGISDAEKLGIEGAFFFGTNLNIHKDPNQLTIMPKSAKESGTVVDGLPKWIVSGAPHDSNIYAYDENGRIYQRNSGGTWSGIRNVANSIGQGLAVVDDYLYYTRHTAVGRYGPLSGGAVWDDNWQTGLQNTATTGYAPIEGLLAGFVIGHGNKVAYWDGSVWDVDALTLPPGLNVRSIEHTDEYVVIGAWKGSSITDSEEGYAFFWDGTAPTWNFDVKLDDGGVNAMLNTRNRLLSVLGSAGFLYLGTQPFAKVQQLPKLDPFKKYLEVLPGAVTNWKGYAMVGVAGNTDDANVVHGIYQYGSKSDKYPEVLNLSNLLSTGNSTGTAIRIGGLLGQGNKLWFGWKDGSSYGVDIVQSSADPYAQATYESLIFDASRTYEQKRAAYLKVTHLPLVSGESIRIDFKKDRASSYTNGTVNSTVGTIETKEPITTSDILFNESQLRVILATSVTTAPTVTSISLEYDDGSEEELF